MRDLNPIQMLAESDLDVEQSLITSEGWRDSAIGATQIEMEELYSKYQLIPAMREDFKKDFADPFFDHDFPVSFGLDLLVQVALHKRTTIETLVGILKHHFTPLEDPETGEITSAAQQCADWILEAAEMDIIDWFPDEKRIVMIYDISAETQKMIDRYQYPLPMIEKPSPVRTNRDTGYRTIRGSIILKKNHHDGDVCLDHINRMNAQRLALSTDVISFVQNQWKNLDRPKNGEGYQDFLKRKKAFNRFDRNSRDVIDAMLIQKDGFYMTHKYDKRGRTYSQGYYVNPQGNDWSKAVVEFAAAEPLKEI